MRFFKFKGKGFTIIELLVVIAIIGILAIVLAPKFGHLINDARNTGVITDFKGLDLAIDRFSIKTDKLPNLAQLNTLHRGDYSFELKRAFIEELDGQKYLTIRAETDDVSPYKSPYAITLISFYNGALPTGDIDIAVNRDMLENVDNYDIKSLFIDCINSKVSPLLYEK